MVIFDSYVSLPEGMLECISCLICHELIEKCTESCAHCLALFWCVVQMVHLRPCPEMMIDDDRWCRSWPIGQGLVNVPVWEYWTSPYSSHKKDHIPNGWVMWKMGTWLMTHVGRLNEKTHRNPGAWHSWWLSPFCRRTPRFWRIWCHGWGR